MDDLIEITVGVITRAHGVRGEVVVELRTDEPERRYAAGQVLRTVASGRHAGRRPTAGTRTAPQLTVLRARSQHGSGTPRWLVSFAEIGDRNAAEAHRGIELIAEVPADDRPDHAEEFYDRQLVGLSVLVEGRRVGAVRAVLHLPAQDVLEIGTEDGNRLVPFVTELVPEVDLAAGTVTVQPVAGLLDDDADVVDGDQAVHDRESGHDQASGHDQESGR